jgi:hypothetical protein
MFENSNSCVVPLSRSCFASCHMFVPSTFNKYNCHVSALPPSRPYQMTSYQNSSIVYEGGYLTDNEDANPLGYLSSPKSFRGGRSQNYSSYERDNNYQYFCESDLLKLPQRAHGRGQNHLKYHVDSDFSCFAVGSLSNS